MSVKVPETIDASARGGRAGGRGTVPLKLVVVAGADQGREVPLEGTAEVGADASCTLVLRDRSVSRRHVSIEQSGTRILVRDLGSRNGVFFGGARIHEGEVPVGAVLTVGD